MTKAEREELRDHITNEISTLKKSISTLKDLLDSEVHSDANDWFTSKESIPSKEINELALEKARRRILMLSEVLKRLDCAVLCVKMD